MKNLCQRFISYGLLGLLLLSSTAAYSLAGVAGVEFAWDYYGPDSYSVSDRVHGETLTLPELTLSGATISFADVDLQPEENIGYGVYLIYDNIVNTNDTTANVLLDSAAAIDVAHLADASSSMMHGISLSSFVDAHVSLLGQSTVAVAAQGTDAYGYGIEVDNSTGEETAEVVIDQGSALTVTATAAENSDNAYVTARAYGIELADNLHVVVNVDNDSTVTVEAKATVGAGEDSAARAYAYGIDSYSSELAEIALAGGATLAVTATAELGDDTVNGIGTATSVGIQGNAQVVTVDLLEGSKVTVESSADHSAKSTGIQVYYDFTDPVDHGEITLDGASQVSAIATTTGDFGDFAGATSWGVDLSAQGPVTAILTAQNGSSIAATATGSGRSEAVAVKVHNSPHAVINIESGSTLSATATTEAHSIAGLDGSAANADVNGLALNLQDIEGAEITLSDATLSTNLTSIASQIETDPANSGGATATIGFDLDSGGIKLSGTGAPDIEVGIALQNTTVTVAAQATASAEVGPSSALGAIAGIGIYNDGLTQLSLAQSVVDVRATATAEDTSELYGFGIMLDNVMGGDEPIIELTDSTIAVEMTAVGTASAAIAYGINVQDAGVDLDDVYTINLDHSTVSAVANSGVDGFAIGLFAAAEEIAINLTNGSQISSSVSAAEGIDAAMYISPYNSATVGLDASSTLSGTWALAAERDSLTDLNNAGTVAGRIVGVNLANTSTGTLQATFGVADTELDAGINYFAKSPLLSELEEYTEHYFTTAEADLAAGTTFHIVTTDDLGLTAEGDTAVYALLAATAGNWEQAELNLTSSNQSSLLDISWDESSPANELNVKFTLLSAAEAGLSANAIAAYEAAAEAGLVTYTSDPEEWHPDVSGAFVAGMAHSLGRSYFNIGKRMAELMGMSSGDEVQVSNSMWISTHYTDAEQDDRNGVTGFDAATTGFSIGIDREFGNSILGFAYTLGSTDADVSDSSAAFDMTDNLFSLYGSYDGGAWYSEAIFSAGFGSVDGQRNVGVDVYRSNYDSTSYNAKIEMGMKLSQQGWQITPLLALQYSLKEYDSYSETGSGGLALNVASVDYSTLTTGIGARALKDFQCRFGTFTPEITGTLNYDIENDPIVTNASFVGGNTAFVTNGVEPSATSWDLGAAITFANFGESNVSFRVGYDYSGRQDFEAHSLSGKLRFEF